MILEVVCTVCGDRARGLCAACAALLPPPPSLAPPPGLASCHALCAYTGTGRELVRELKFHNQRGALRLLADRLASAMADQAIEVVTFAPTTAARRRTRGFDQAELLARQLARSAGVPLVRTLVRLPGPCQTGLHGDARRSGPSFDARRRIVSSVAGRRVGLVDDVVTTGATLHRAAVVLRAAGAISVHGFVIARTPKVAVRGQCAGGAGRS